MKKLNKVFKGLIYALPAVLFFSYYPIIAFGSDNTMNFELSLPLIWLVLFDLVSLVLLVREKRLGGIFKWWTMLLFPIFASLSLIWSLNLVRGILTVGIMWLVYFASLVVVSLRDIVGNKEDFCRNFLKGLFLSSLLVCGWCLVQSILDAAGLSREQTLMCPGCVSQMFGFPHPNGFAIEPQFMGNLLLAPALVAVWLYFKRQNNKNLGQERSRGDNFYNGSVGAHTKLQFRDSLRDRCKNYSGSRFLCPKFLLFYFFIIVSTLFLTFSRGAIYSFIVAMMFMSGFLLVREKKRIVKRLMMVWGVVILSFLSALNLQGIMAAVGPTNTTYGSAVTKVLNHLSLGIIDVREKELDGVPVNMPDDAPVYDGYVEESTNIRMELTRNAIKVWSKDFKNAAIGVGIGGAGKAMYDEGLIWSPKEIVQNEYASVLLELGLVGVVLALIVVVLLFRVFAKSPASALLLPLLVAYGVSLFFFSGFANALQIYILPVVFYIVFRKKLVS